MRCAALAASAAPLLLLSFGHAAPSPAPAPGPRPAGAPPAFNHTVSHVSRDADFDTVSSARAAINAMNFFYDNSDGRWTDSDAWWVSGNALQTILDFMYKTRSSDYMQYAQYTFAQQRGPLQWWPEGGGNFRAESTDDTGWWALAMLRFYDITHDRTYLEVAMDDEAYMHKYWNQHKCGGGTIWDVKSLSYKNAISNELYMAVAAALHRRIPGDKKYLKKAQDTWKWFKKSGMINSHHLINDGLAEKDGGRVCHNNGGQVWSYNQGVILGALVDLHKATGNNKYLHEAKLIANAVIHSPSLSPNGILTESCEAKGDCDNNSRMFKGIFARNLGWLDDALSDHPYRSYLLRNARTMKARDNNGHDFYDVSWSGPFRGSDIATQASAVSLLVAAI